MRYFAVLVSGVQDESCLVTEVAEHRVQVVVKRGREYYTSDVMDKSLVDVLTKVLAGGWVLSEITLVSELRELRPWHDSFDWSARPTLHNGDAFTTSNLPRPKERG